MKTTSEGGFESRQALENQNEIMKLPNPSSLLEGRNIRDYLERRKRISAFSLTQPVNSLARSEQAADFVVPETGTRVLVYPRTDADDNAHAVFESNKIPQFATEAAANPDIRVVRIPLNAWRLDSTDFQEQEPTFPAGNGAIEIMHKLGTLLHKIQVKTKTLPVDFQLCQIAYVTGDNEFIRLVPPYSLSEDVDPEEIVRRVEEDLRDIDPSNPHESQIKALRSSLFRTAK